MASDTEAASTSELNDNSIDIGSTGLKDMIKNLSADLLPMLDSEPSLDVLRGMKYVLRKQPDTGSSRI